MSGNSLTDAQYHAVQTGLTTLGSWIFAVDDTEDALLNALRRSDQAAVAVGLATVGRLLALELGSATGRSERRVLADLADIVRRLHGPDSRPVPRPSQTNEDDTTPRG